jgi:serine protease Do
MDVPMRRYQQMLALTRMIRSSVVCLAGYVLTAQAQTIRKNSVDALDQFSESVQSLAARVALSVVQISVTRYAPREDADGGRAGIVLGRQQTVGSGVIIDPDGYIVTNAHVVANALRIRVTRAAQSASSAEAPDQTITSALAMALAAPVDATLVGIFKELDLALIRIPLPVPHDQSIADF